MTTDRPRAWWSHGGRAGTSESERSVLQAGRSRGVSSPACGDWLLGVTRLSRPPPLASFHRNHQSHSEWAATRRRPPGPSSRTRTSGRWDFCLWARKQAKTMLPLQQPRQNASRMALAPPVIGCTASPGSSARTVTSFRSPWQRQYESEIFLTGRFPECCTDD